MDVVQKHSQVPITIAIRYNKSYSVAWETGAWTPGATHVDIVVESLQLVVRRRPRAHVYEPYYTHGQDDSTSVISV